MRVDCVYVYVCMYVFSTILCIHVKLRVSEKRETEKKRKIATCTSGLPNYQPCTVDGRHWGIATASRLLRYNFVVKFFTVFSQS